MVEEGMMGRGGGGGGVASTLVVDGETNHAGGARTKREMQVTRPCCSPCLSATHLRPNTTRIVRR